MPANKADELINELLPSIARFTRLNGKKVTAHHVLGMALGVALEAGIEPLEIIKMVVVNLETSQKCPICGRTETHYHDFEERTS